MEFNKYKNWGAYHWNLYSKKSNMYSDHVDKVISWIRDGDTLDIGAGDGLITHLLGCDGIDDNEIAVQLAQEKGANVKLCSAYDLPTNKLYDNVIMINVIEHLQYYTQVLDKIREILKPDGLLYVTTCPAKGNKLQDKYHYFEWSPDEFKERLKDCGYEYVSLEVMPEICEMYGVFKL